MIVARGMGRPGNLLAASGIGRIVYSPVTGGTYVMTSSGWAAATGFYAHDGSQWIQASQMYVYRSGVWTQVW